MSAYLKSMDKKTWKAVRKGWEHPVVLDKDCYKIEVLKPEEEWTEPEDELALANSKALNALFNGVDKNMFRLTKNCNVCHTLILDLKILVQISLLSLIPFQFTMLYSAVFYRASTAYFLLLLSLIFLHIKPSRMFSYITSP